MKFIEPNKAFNSIDNLLRPISLSYIWKMGRSILKILIFMIYMKMHFTDDKEAASDSKVNDPNVLQPNYVSYY